MPVVEITNFIGVMLY